MYSISTEHLSLTYRVREPQVTPAIRRAVILLHGVGSNENDLFGLEDQLPDDLYVVAPRGTFVLGSGRFAWYDVDFSSGRPVIDAKQEALSREVIHAFVKQLKQKYRLDEVYLGGFSQGAIVGYSFGLTHPNEIQGIIALSGRLLDEIKPLVSQQADLSHVRVFLAHGVHDNVLGVHYAREARKYLEGLHVSVDYHEYGTAHGIDENILHDLRVWLASLKSSDGESQ